MSRKILLLLLSTLLVGCSYVWENALNTLKDGVIPPKSKPLVITRENVDNSPYYQLHVEIPQAEAILVLTRINQDFRYWQTSTEESLVLSNGLIYRTSGLVNNLEQTRFIGPNPFASGLHKIQENTLAIREIDLNGYRYGIKVSSHFHIIGYESITIIDNKMKLLHVDELIDAPQINLSATNHYWVDDKGFIWKSEQYLWPDFLVKITELRPYQEEIK